MNIFTKNITRRATMKNIRKLIAVMLILCSIFVLASCGNSGSGNILEYMETKVESESKTFTSKATTVESLKGQLVDNEGCLIYMRNNDIAQEELPQ